MEKYEKLRVVGRGAFGVVHLIQNLATKQYLIMKQIPVEAMTRDQRIGALNEVKVLSILNHPNIIKYYENFLEEAALMIIMEYAEGGTLFEYIQNSKNLISESIILRYFTQLLMAIQHIHSKQILHRDLKTQNILLDKTQKVVKIVDFGISKVLTHTNANSVVGTPCYISPELCEGKPYNQKSDIWALGCILYEMTTLKKAFEAPTLPAVVMKIMRGSYTPIADQYSKELSSLIISLLQLNPEIRPTANQLMALPIVVNTLLDLLDIGSIEYKQDKRCSQPAAGRINRSSSRVNNKNSAGLSRTTDDSPVLHLKPLCKIWCWGNGISRPVCLPLPATDAELSDLSCSRNQKSAVTKNGNMFVWESPPYGVETEHQYVPRLLEGQSAVTIQNVSCGDLFIACVTDRGILMTFGSGANGCLGHGDFNDVAQAKIVEALLGYEVMMVSCGPHHIMTVTNDHEVFGWGLTEGGRLGLGTEESLNLNKPVQIETLPRDSTSVQVTCGVNSSVVLTEQSRIFCTGNNRFNKLGLDSADVEYNEVIYSFQEITKPILKNKKIKQFSIGNSHSAVLTDSGDVYTFGSNQFSQLGVGNTTETRHIQHVSAIHDVIQISCGDTFTVAVTNNGGVYTWGNKSRGRLGNADQDSLEPQRIDINTENMKLVALSASNVATLIAFMSSD